MVAFAGYTKQMESLIAYNDGLLGRFPITLLFDDFTDVQLLNIYLDLVKSSKFMLSADDPKYARILSRRLGRQRGEYYKFLF